MPKMTIKESIEYLQPIADSAQLAGYSVALRVALDAMREVEELRTQLKAYTDTGLSPCVCKAYKAFEDEAISKGVTFNRIVELMEAERAERVLEGMTHEHD